MPTQEPQRHPTLAELRAKAQPIEVRSRRNAEHWSAQLYLRHFSIYFTMLLVRTRISANGVTGLMILSGW
ncbi:MAG: CDP-alcohol phosphatidyltransferase family protein, partial [Yaniella sp.]|nr:CDP-alcohol phosphatidyltransferase family protein [Yaniella sp.]